jgi:hypothetical protein
MGTLPPAVKELDVGLTMNRWGKGKEDFFPVKVFIDNDGEELSDPSKASQFKAAQVGVFC